MPRALRPQVADLVYHVGSRGCEKRDIFDVVPADREFFLWLLGKVVTKYRWRLHAYCLMGNHFHLVLETPQANLAVGMQYLKSVYAQWFNGVHPEREGVLFERRYWSRIATEERYLYELARYVALNPVRCGWTRRPEEWEWSSYAATIGLARAPSFLTVEAVLDLFGKGAEARTLFAQFVGEGIADPERAGEAVWAMARV